MGACRSLSSSRGLPLVDVQFTADCITLVIINGRERCFCINFMLALWAILVQTCDETSVFFRLLLWFPSLILVENGRSLMTQCYLLKPYFFLTLGFALLAWLFFCNATQDWHSAAVSIEPQKCWVFFPAAGDLRTYASLVRRVEAEFVGPPNVRKTSSESLRGPSESKKAWISEMDALLWDLGEFLQKLYWKWKQVMILNKQNKKRKRSLKLGRVRQKRIGI